MTDDETPAKPARGKKAADPYANYPYGVRASMMMKDGLDPGPSPVEAEAEAKRKAKLKKK